MSLNKHFGAALKKYIEENKINGAGIAELLNMTAPGFYAYYNSKNPYDVTRAKILTALGITEDELFGIEKVEENNEVIELRRMNQELQFKLNVVYEELIQYKNKQNAELQAVNH